MTPGPIFWFQSGLSAVAFQRKRLPPQPIEAKRLPSGLKATAQTSSGWPSGFPTSLPWATFQMQIVLSTEPEASRVPPGWNDSP